MECTCKVTKDGTITCLKCEVALLENDPFELELSSIHNTPINQTNGLNTNHTKPKGLGNGEQT